MIGFSTVKLSNPRPTPVKPPVWSCCYDTLSGTAHPHTAVAQSASQNLLPDVSGKQIIPRFVSVYSVKAGPKQQEMGPREKEDLQGTEGNFPQTDH